MQFRIITPEVLRFCLSNLLRNNYLKEYEEFNKSTNLDISEKQFEEFKKREITLEEINQIISKTDFNKGEVIRIRTIWNKYQEKILSTINELSGLLINTNEIICYVDPYQKGGYYGEDNITIGTYKNPEDVLFVIAHELFHIFYWKKLTELGITKSTMGNESSEEWALSEVTAHLITTEPKMKEYWKNIEIEIYPEIKGLFEKVKGVWKENSFEDYLKKSYKLLK